MNISLEASSFNCSFISFLGLRTNNYSDIFHSVVISEAMMTSLFVEFLCRVLAGFSNLQNDYYCLWCFMAGTVDVCTPENAPEAM